MINTIKDKKNKITLLIYPNAILAKSLKPLFKEKYAITRFFLILVV